MSSTSIMIGFESAYSHSCTFINSGYHVNYNLVLQSETGTLHSLNCCYFLIIIMFYESHLNFHTNNLKSFLEHMFVLCTRFSLNSHAAFILFCVLCVELQTLSAPTNTPLSILCILVFICSYMFWYNCHLQVAYMY
jgi:uncharacterized protein YfbU (UPF0304 family)